MRYRSSSHTGRRPELTIDNVYTSSEIDEQAKG